MWGGRLTTLRLSHTATRPSSLRFCKIPRLVVPVLVARQHLCGRRRPPAPLQHVHLCAHRRVVAQLDQRVARHPRLLERALVRVSVAAPNGSVVFSAGPVPSPPFGAVLFPAVPFSPGTLTAEGLVADGTTVLASDAARSWGAPAALVLSLDAPSLATGTGDGALLLDGGDVALVRATVVDAAGNPCGDATDNITFAVSSPGASESLQRGLLGPQRRPPPFTPCPPSHWRRQRRPERPEPQRGALAGRLPRPRPCHRQGCPRRPRLCGLPRDPCRAQPRRGRLADVGARVAGRGAAPRLHDHLCERPRPAARESEREPLARPCGRRAGGRRAQRRRGGHRGVGGGALACVARDGPPRPPRYILYRYRIIS